MSFGRLYNHQESRFQSRYAMNNPNASLPVIAATQDIAQAQPSCLEIRGKKNEVRWDNTAAVTTRGAQVYFAQFLDAAGVFDRLVAGAPLEYASNKAPEPGMCWARCCSPCSAGTGVTPKSTNCARKMS